MAETIQPQAEGPARLPLPDPEKLKPSGLSNKHKRYLYYGIFAALGLLIIANIVGTKQTPAVVGPKPPSTAQQQNPSPAQIRDWENGLKQAEAQLEQEKRERQQQLEAVRAAQEFPSNDPAAELARAEALHQAATAGQPYPPTYASGGPQYGQAQPQKSQIETEQEQQAYKSLFADNVVRQASAPSFSREPHPPAQTSSPAVPNAPPVSEQDSRSPDSKDRKPLDFDPNAQPAVWLPEGIVIEAVLTNRLVGDAAGPVDCMITSDVFQPGTRVLLIPQGARVLGNASAVSSLGQARLAVAFHRIIVPGLHTYSIPLDKLVPALAQASEVGLHDKANNHYASIFGASLAIGAIGGLAQIGNGYSGFGYDPSVALRNGVTQSMGQSSARILDRLTCPAK
jgi:type IV secretory pathway VirB10-like protein